MSTFVVFVQYGSDQEHGLCWRRHEVKAQNVEEAVEKVVDTYGDREVHRAESFVHGGICWVRVISWEPSP